MNECVISARRRIRPVPALNALRAMRQRLAESDLPPMRSAHRDGSIRRIPVTASEE